MKISPELNNEAATDSCDQLSVYNIRLKCIPVYHNQVTLCYKDVFSHSVPWDFLLHCLLFWEFPSECVQGESVSFSLSLLSISLVLNGDLDGRSVSAAQDLAVHARSQQGWALRLWAPEDGRLRGALFSGLLLPESWQEGFMWTVKQNIFSVWLLSETIKSGKWSWRSSALNLHSF